MGFRLIGKPNLIYHALIDFCYSTSEAVPVWDSSPPPKGE